MEKKFSKYITNKLINISIIKNNEKDLYQYGFEIAIHTVLTLSIIMVISILIKNFKETLIFLSSFLSVRGICGGYHANKKTTCSLMTIGSHFLYYVLYSIFLNHNYVNEIFLVIILSTVIPIFLFSPVDNYNNPMSSYRKRKNRKASIILVVLIMSIYPLFYLFNLSTRIVLPIGFGTLFASGSIIMAVIEKIYKKHQEASQ